MKSDKLERLKGNLDAMRYILGEAIERNVNIGDDYSAVSVYVYAVEDAIDNLQLAAESLPMTEEMKRGCATCKHAAGNDESCEPCASCCEGDAPYSRWEPKSK